MVDAIVCAESLALVRAEWFCFKRSQSSECIVRASRQDAEVDTRSIANGALFIESPRRFIVKLLLFGLGQERLRRNVTVRNSPVPRHSSGMLPSVHRPSWNAI